MDGFTLIDGIVAIIIVVSALLAYARGLTREALSIVGWIAAGVLAFIFAPQAEPLVKEIPGLNKLLADSCELSMIAAFAVVFTVALLVLSLFTPLFSSLVQRSIFGGLDQALGFLFGVARGIVLVAVAYFVYDTMLPTQRFEIVDNSRSAAVFSRMSDNIEERNPEAALGWVTTQYEQLVSVCDAS